jgi:DNA-binding MarR family transcriptional regulator
MSDSHDQQLAASLRTVLSRLVKKLRGKTTSGQRFSLTERSVFALLNQHKQMLPSELASIEKITNQSMSQILSHLDELGYIVRTPSETDKRKVFISLSESGESILMKMRSEREEWLIKAINDTCTHQERELLKKVITPLTKLVDYEL